MRISETSGGVIYNGMRTASRYSTKYLYIASAGTYGVTIIGH